MYLLDIQIFSSFAQAKVLFCSSKIKQPYKSTTYKFAQAKIFCSSKSFQTLDNQQSNFHILLKQILAKKICSSKSA